MFSRYLKMAALCVGVTIIAAAGTASLMAQTFPAQPIKVIVGFEQASFPELTDERAIKKAIPNSKVISLFGELLYGKKDAAPPQQNAG